MKYREIHIKEEDTEVVTELLTNFILKQNHLRNLCLQMQGIEEENLNEDMLYSHIYWSIVNKNYSTIHLMKEKKKTINLNKLIVGPWFNLYTMLSEISKKRMISDDLWAYKAKHAHNGYELLKIYNNYKLFHLSDRENDNLLNILDPNSKEYSYLKLLLSKTKIEESLKNRYGEEEAKNYISYLNSYENKEKDKLLFIYSGNATIEEYEEFTSSLGKDKKRNNNKMIRKISKNFFKQKK